MAFIVQHQALAGTFAVARTYAEKASKALAIFPESEIKTAMLELLEFSVNREY